MKKKVLCIGCSHLAGAYDKNDNIVGPESWAWHLWNFRGRTEQFYTLPNPGQGIMQYAALINYLDNNNLLSQLDTVIIQLTSEPRLVWHSAEFNSYYEGIKGLLSLNDDFVSGRILITTDTTETIFSSNQRRMYELYQNKFTTTTEKSIWLDVTDLVSQGMTSPNSIFNSAMFSIYYSYIVNTLQKHNIKYIVFDWWGKTTNDWDSISRIERGEFLFTDTNRSVKDLLLSKNEWVRDLQSVGGHMSSELVTPIAKYIHEDIIKRQLM